MKYAIISDIHGNITALDAVLSDCQKQNIDQYIFLGDYYGEFSTMNEVRQKLKNTENTCIIRGNGEDRLDRLIKENPNELTGAQYAPLHWYAKQLNKEDYDFIENMPQVITIKSNDINLFLAHAPIQHFGKGVTEKISCRTFLDEYGVYYSNHNEYLSYIRKLLRNDNDFKIKITELPEGIYLFGHYHTQWHDELDNRIIINPGSCGYPLDFNTDAAYTILDTTNEISITEHRVKYDKKLALKLLEESSIKEDAPVWHKLAILSFKNAKEELLPLLEYVYDLAKKHNENTDPFTDKFWDEATTQYIDIKLNN